MMEPQRHPDPEPSATAQEPDQRAAGFWARWQQLAAVPGQDDIFTDHFTDYFTAYFTDYVVIQ